MTPKEINTKTVLKFLLRFALINCIWIVPLVAFFLHGTLLKALFFSFLVSYTYLSALKYFGKKPVTLQKVSLTINVLYYLSVFIFLGLTGVATYEGIINVFGLVGWHKGFAVVFATGIPIALFVITLFIKERKTPSLILGALILYLLFDSMTALPFNYLFFYENLKIASNVESDKKNLSVVINACDSVITPKYETALNNLRNINSRVSNAMTEDETNKQRRLESDKAALREQLSVGTISQEQYNNQFNYLKIKYRPKEIKRSVNENERFNKSYADSISYRVLLDTLQTCKSRKLTLNNIINTDNATKLSNEIKMDLISVCNGSKDTTLMSYVKLLYPNQPSALQSIKQLYMFIGNKFVGNELKIADNSTQSYDKDTDMLITMSLSSSLVIDILPLLLSLLYAKFKRDD